MKVNATFLVMALALFCVWGLRRLGVDDTTADTIVTLLVLGLGVAPSALPKLGRVALAFVALAGVGGVQDAAAATNLVPHQTASAAARAASSAAVRPAPRPQTTASACAVTAVGEPASSGALAVVVVGLLSFGLWRHRRLLLVGLAGLTLGACTPSVLADCTIEISRAGPDGDRLTCQDREPIKLKNMDSELRALLLRHYGGRP